MSEPRIQLSDDVTLATSLPDLRKSASTSSMKIKHCESDESTVSDIDYVEGTDDVTNSSGAATSDDRKPSKADPSDQPSFDDDVFVAKVPEFFKYYEFTKTPSEETSDSESSSDDESDASTDKESDDSSAGEKSSGSTSESDENDSDLRLQIAGIKISKPKTVRFTVIVEEKIEFEVTNYQQQGRSTRWVPKLTDKTEEEQKPV